MPLVFGMSPENPELDHREDQDHCEEHPGHGRSGAESEEALKGRLVQMLDHGPGRIARPPLSHDEDLPEDLEGPDDVDDEDEEEHRPEQIVAAAKAVPVIGNGDVTTPEAALGKS